MSLIDQISLLATSVKTKLNTMTPRLLPPNGTPSQVLAKTSNTSYMTAWVDPSAVVPTSVIDASLGEEIVTTIADRDFSGTNNWVGTGWSISSGTFLHTAGANNATLSMYLPTSGDTYQVTLTVITTSVGFLSIQYGGVRSNLVGQIVGTLTGHTFVLTATSSEGLIIIPSATWVGSINNVSIKKINGSTSAQSYSNERSQVCIEIRPVSATSFGIGLSSLVNSLSGINNLAIGYRSLNFNTIGNYNTAVGSAALRSNTTGIGNTAVGSHSLEANTTGQYNTAVGPGSLQKNITASFNTGFGAYSLNGNMTGTNNTCVGYQSLSLTTVSDNTAIGYSALQFNIVGVSNTAVGSSSLINNTASFNTAIGMSSLLENTTGVNNTSVGYQTLLTNTTGSNNTALGSVSLPTQTSYSNTTGVGYQATVTGSDQVQLGNSATTTYVYGTVQARSDENDKAEIRDTVLGLNFINQLRPVDFKWDMREDYRQDFSTIPTMTVDKPIEPTLTVLVPTEPILVENPTEEELSDYNIKFEQYCLDFDNYNLILTTYNENLENYNIELAKYVLAKNEWVENNKLSNIKTDGSKIRKRFHHGLIAQELAKVIENSGIDFGGYQDHSIGGGDAIKTIGYGEFFGPVIKSIQELSVLEKQNAEILQSILSILERNNIK